MNGTVRKKSGVTFLTGMLLLLLFLATLNTINRYYYFVFIAFFVFLMKPDRRFRIDVSVAALFFLGFFWMVFSPGSTNSVLSVAKPFTYVLCFFMGFGFLEDKAFKENEESVYTDFYRLLIVVSAGPFVNYLLNWLKNGDASERNTVDFWTGSAKAATGQAGLACLVLAIAIACIFSKTSIKIKLLSVATISIILGYNLILSGRTLIVLTLIILAIALLHRIAKQKKGRFQTIFLVAIAIIAIVYAYSNDVFGIKTLVESSPLYDRFYGEYSQDIASDGRLDRKLYYLKNFWDHPFGGIHIRPDIGYAHDIFLDTYDEAGIFALIAMITYIASSIGRLIRCTQNKSYPFVFRQIVLCVYLVLYLEFMIEPVMQAMPALFATFCIIDGAVGKILLKSRAQADIK